MFDMDDVSAFTIDAFMTVEKINLCNLKCQIYILCWLWKSESKQVLENKHGNNV